MLCMLTLLTEVSGVFALATSSASEINALLTEISSGNDRLSDLVQNTNGQSHRHTQLESWMGMWMTGILLGGR